MWGLQKLGLILESKVVQKLSLEKNVFNKKCSPKLIFLDEFFFRKNSVDFWHRKLTLKVQFWHFLRPWHYVNLQNTAISFECSWFLSKNLAFYDPSSKKLYDLTDINVHKLPRAHYRKKYDKHTSFSISLYAHGVFLHPPCTIILNFSTMVQLTLSFLDLQVYMKI